MKRILYLLLLSLLGIGLNRPALAQKQYGKYAKKVVKKEATVYVTRTGSKYHKEYFSFLRLSSIPMKKSDAQSSGYTACRRCSP